jgi:DNA mismatch repair protein MutS
VKPGPASRSYGLAVAQKAGVPKAVIEAARGYLGELESQRGSPDGGPVLSRKGARPL